MTDSGGHGHDRYDGLRRRLLPGGGLDRAGGGRGLLIVGQSCRISTYALFRPTDDVGEVRPIRLGAGVLVGAFAVVHGGTDLGDAGRVEDHCVVGQPERGYAVRQHFSGAGAPTVIGAGSVVRAGA